MKKVVVALVLAASLLAMAAPFGLGLVAVLFGAAAASTNACVTGVGAVADAGGPVRWPLAGTFQVTSEYGMRSNPGSINYGQYRMHWGMDLSYVGASGPVVAAKAGVVTATPTTTTGGNTVVVDHGAGLATSYLHLASRVVDVGDPVWAGAVLGIEGSTGNSSGAHLHFEVEVSGERVNPRAWLTEQGLTVPPTRGVTTAAAAVLVDPGPAQVGTIAFPAEPAAAAGPSGSATNPVTSSLAAQVGTYAAEQVTNAGLIIRAGQAMGLDATTITIGVMTAMGESSLRNVSYGDIAGPDSRGLFQQRANGAWGTLADRMDPTTAATNFYRALVAVPGYLDLEPTIAAHRTQRNADPYHYRTYWAPAVQMVATLTEDPALLDDLEVNGPLTGCADGDLGAPLPAGDGSGASIVAAAEHYLGTTYSWGGGSITGPTLGIYQSGSLDGSRTVGFDCSGLVQFAVHNATGVTLSHSAEAQGKDPRGRPVPRDYALLERGDVISFSEDGSAAPGSFGHVGIYVGEGKMIHAPRPGRTVEIVQLQGSSYYEPMAWSIRRYSAAP